MGTNASKQKLTAIIQLDKPDDLIVFLKQAPDFINQELNIESHHTPLLKAVWKQNYTITNILLGQFRANPNLFGGKYTPLMVAAIHGNTNLLSLLIYFSADSTIVNKDGYSAIDLAILFGHYKAAIYLKDKCRCSYRTVWQAFQNRRLKLKLPYVNYKLMIEYLIDSAPIEIAVSAIYKKDLQTQNGTERQIKSTNKTYNKVSDYLSRTRVLSDYSGRYDLQNTKYGLKDAIECQDQGNSVNDQSTCDPKTRLTKLKRGILSATVQAKGINDFYSKEQTIEID